MLRVRHGLNLFHLNFYHMEKYMFIFFDGDTSNLSPEEQQAAMEKWFEWVEKLRSQNRYVEGEALLPAGKTISGTKKVVTDGPFTESKEVVGGYFIVLAKDFNEAVELAQDFPDFHLGGKIQVREVIKFDNA